MKGSPHESSSTLEVLTDAMFVAACRKFAACLNNGPSQPIGSMRYCEITVEEVQERPFPPGMPRLYPVRSSHTGAPVGRLAHEDHRQRR